MARRSSTATAATWAQTYGVPVEEIVEGIKHGVRKVNIDTDLRMASTGAIRKLPGREQAKDFDPRKFLIAATKAMKDICKARYEAFGAAGQASKIKKVFNLEEMAEALRQGRTRSQGQLIVGLPKSGAGIKWDAAASHFLCVHGLRC